MGEYPLHLLGQPFQHLPLHRFSSMHCTYLWKARYYHVRIVNQIKRQKLQKQRQLNIVCMYQNMREACFGKSIIQGMESQIEFLRRVSKHKVSELFF